jgi:hypothetical protein
MNLSVVKLNIVFVEPPKHILLPYIIYKAFANTTLSIKFFYVWDRGRWRGRIEEGEWNVLITNL